MRPLRMVDRNVLEELARAAAWLPAGVSSDPTLVAWFSEGLESARAKTREARRLMGGQR